MRRSLGRLSVDSLFSRSRTSRWLAWFAIGAMLGSSILLLRLSLEQLQSVNRTEYNRYFTASEKSLQTGAHPRSSEAADGKRVSSGSTGQSLQGTGADGGNEQPEALEDYDQPDVHVYLTKEKRIEKVPLEVYVRGVLAAEMPVEFELEALKAQAIAARTFIVRRLLKGDREGVPVQGADVIDTALHQVYISERKLSELWNEDVRPAKLNKLNEAVNQTKGLIITYEGEPIQAAFFSTSNGYTENSEDYWQQELPYLRSVESPWDEEISPKYKETVVMKVSEFYRKLGLKNKDSSSSAIRIVEKTDGKRIGKIAIDGSVFTGREVREKLGLASSQFSWSFKDDSIFITTYGYGHGVGMSQWGANGMAKEGAAAADILNHYYSSTVVEQASKLRK
ncbi:Amidase enhancer precursor [compost metagenome]